MSSGERGAVCQGGVFVVAGVVAEAAVQDADEAVAQGAEGLVVGCPSASVSGGKRQGAQSRSGSASQDGLQAPGDGGLQHDDQEPGEENVIRSCLLAPGSWLLRAP